MDVTTASTSGWIAVLLCLGVLCNGYFFYSFVRRRRFRRPDGPGFTARVEGRLVGRVGALAYRTEEGAPGRAEEVLIVEQEGRTILVAVGGETRGVRAGSYLCADGTPVVLLRDETLYRQPAEPGLLARRLVVGYWPELGWLRVPAAIGCLIWLLGVGAWFGLSASTVPSGRLFNHAPAGDVVPTSR
jgi:hypothetical protein